MQIREMEFEDLQKVFKLGESLFTPEGSTILYRTWDEYEILERFVGDWEYCLVSEDERGKICGFIFGTIVEKRKSSWVYGYILWMGVSKRFQKLGLGKKLMDSLIRRFKKRGVKILIVDTAASNEGAIRFFKKNKFSDEDPHLYFYRNLSKD